MTSVDGAHEKMKILMADSVGCQLLSITCVFQNVSEEKKLDFTRTLSSTVGIQRNNYTKRYHCLCQQIIIL